jgi:voltage-gated sodium channel
MGIQKRLNTLKSSPPFQYLVTIVILLSSVLVGAGTYAFDGTLFSILLGLDLLITVFFIIEILIRFFSESKKRNFFNDGWNIFDSIIVISSLIPAGVGTSLVVLRLLRLARLLRIISFAPELRFVIESLIESLKQSVNVIVLIFILLYIYAVAGVILFGTVEGGRFEQLGEALMTLFQIMTLSSWEAIMLPMTDIYSWSWFYFVSFVFLSSVITLNLFIAILVDVVSEQRKRRDN